MPISSKFRAPFYPGFHYHMLFKSIDGVKLFHDRDDRLFFLQQFDLFLRPVVNSLAYALLDNHSHFIVQVKDEKDLIKSVLSVPKQFRTKPMQAFAESLDNDAVIANLLERQVNSFMSSYAIVTNKANSRKGGLFQSPFRRCAVAGDQHLQQAIIYTHANAQKHGIVRDFRKYPYTSYHEILSGNSQHIHAGIVLDFFGGKQAFVQSHKMQVDYFYGHKWPVSILEKDQ